MSSSKTPMPLKHIAAIAPYNAGLSAAMFEKTYGIPCKAKLDSNENPLGPSPSAIDAAMAALRNGHRYPDGSARALREAIARRVGVSVDQIQVGNGSEELINMIYRSVLSEGHKVVTVIPSFGLHELSADLCRAETTKLPFERDWAFPVEPLLDALKQAPRIFVISSPSNPVGSAIEDADFSRIIDCATSDTLLILDEAYVEFLPSERRESRLEMLKTSGLNWVVLRTFSKAYGLAGFRVGYTICSDVTMAHAIKKSSTPFNVNLVALEAALAAYSDTEHLEKSVAFTNFEIRRLTDDLRSMGLSPSNSFSNAVFFDVGQDASDVAETLREKGILVKAWKEPGYQSCMRVSVGMPEENRHFLSCLKSVL